MGALISLARAAWVRFGALALGEKLALLFVVGALAAAMIAGGVVAGWLASQERVPERLQARLAERARHEDLRDGAIDVPWQEIASNRHLIEYAWLPISTQAGGGGLAELGPNLVFASASGRLDYMTADFRVGDVGLTAPMNWDGLRASGILDNPLFLRGSFRVHDVLAIARASEIYDLYVSHLRYRDMCFEIVVSATDVRSDGGGVAPLSGRWREVFVSRQCLPLRPDAIAFGGIHSGGRLAQRTGHSLLLTIGDYQYDGVNAQLAASMDPQSDLGKVFEIDLRTSRSRVFVSGLRNAQGLLVARDGRIWLTEHGPQGGDELNLLRDGGNYGWPIETYGTNYTQPPDNDWPVHASIDRRNAFEPPRFAFVPAIGISNLIEPDVAEFPDWSGHLLISSLRATSLFLARLEGDRVAYIEPIAFGQGRMRDIISLRDGRIAIQTDAGAIVLIRNGDEAPGVSEVIRLSGLNALSAPLPEEAGSFDPNPEQRGAEVFARACGRCHSPSDEMYIGPPILTVVGRDIAAVEGFSYSSALSRQEGAWTRDRLEALIFDPQGAFPGVAMPPVAITRDEFDNLYAFLQARAEQAGAAASP